MNGIFGSPKAPSAASPPPTADEAAKIAEAQRQAKIAAGTYSSKSTIMTGPQGDTSKAPAKQKTLLGE